MTTVSAIVVYVFTVGDLERTLSTNPESQLPSPLASTPLGKTQTSNVMLWKCFAGHQTMTKMKEKKNFNHSKIITQFITDLNEPRLDLTGKHFCELHIQVHETPFCLFTNCLYDN